MIDFERDAVKLAAMTEALDAAIIALDDWACITAPLFCDDKRVADANTSVKENGTVWYIATVLEQCRNAKDL